jgi:hypothetical protein
MINFAVFSPLGRVLAVLITQIKGRGLSVSEIEMTVPEIGYVGRFSLDNIDVDVGDTVSQREMLASLDSFSVELKFFRDGATFKSGKVIVNNVLLTDAPVYDKIKFGKEEVVNGFMADGTRCAYPEAVVTTAYGMKYEALGSGQRPSSIRPFYQYNLASWDVDSDEFIIEGPSNILFTLVGTGVLQHGKNKYVLLKNGNPQTIVSSPERRSDLENKNSFGIILSDSKGGLETHYKFGQQTFSMNGHSLSARAQLFVLALATYYEAVRAGLIEVKGLDSHLEIRTVKSGNSVQTELVIPVRLNSDNRYVLETTIEEFIFGYVLPNDHIRTIFDGFGINSFDDQLLLTRKVEANTVVGLISGAGKSHACFALASSRLISINLGDSYTTWLTTLKGMVDDGLLKKDVDDTFYGDTSAILNKTAILESDAYIFKQLKISRKDYTMKEAPDGYLLVGLDPWSQNRQNGPDHWVIVFKKGDSWTLVYDPLMSPIAAVGSDIHSLISTSSETSIRSFEVEGISANAVAFAAGGENWQIS